MAPRINLLESAQMARLVEHEREMKCTTVLPKWTCLHCGTRHSGPREPKIDLCPACSDAHRKKVARARTT